jgi:hypothetical protein
MISFLVDFSTVLWAGNAGRKRAGYNFVLGLLRDQDCHGCGLLMVQRVLECDASPDLLSVGKRVEEPTEGLESRH